MKKNSTTLINILTTPILLLTIIVPTTVFLKTDNNSPIENSNNITEQKSNIDYLTYYGGEFLHSTTNPLNMGGEYVEEVFPLSDGSILVSSYEENYRNPGEKSQLVRIYDQSKYNNNNNNSDYYSGGPIGFSPSKEVTSGYPYQGFEHIIPIGSNKFLFVEKENNNNSSQIAHTKTLDLNSVAPGESDPLNTNVWSNGSIEFVEHPVAFDALFYDKNEYEALIYNDDTNLIGLTNNKFLKKTQLVKLTEETTNNGKWIIKDPTNDIKDLPTIGSGTKATYSNQRILDIKTLNNGDSIIIQEQWEEGYKNIVSKSITLTTIKKDFDFANIIPEPTVIYEVKQDDDMFDVSLSAEAIEISNTEILIGTNQGKVISYNPKEGIASEPIQVLKNPDTSIPVELRNPTITTLEKLSNGDVIAIGGSNIYTTLNHFDSSENNGDGSWGESYDWNEKPNSDMDSTILEVKEIEGKDIVIIAGQTEGYGIFDMKTNKFEKTINSHSPIGENNQISDIVPIKDSANPKNDHYLIMGEGYYNKLVFNDSDGIPEWNAPSFIDEDNLFKVTNSTDGSANGSIEIVDGEFNDYFSVASHPEALLDGRDIIVDEFDPIANTISHNFSYIWDGYQGITQGLFPGEYNISIGHPNSDATSNANSTYEDFVISVGADDLNVPYEASYDVVVENEEGKDSIIKIENGSYTERGTGVVSKVEVRAIDTYEVLDYPDKAWEEVDTIDLSNKTFSHTIKKSYDDRLSNYNNEIQIRFTYNDGTSTTEKISDSKPTPFDGSKLIYSYSDNSWLWAIIGGSIGGAIVLIGGIVGGWFFWKSKKSNTKSKLRKDKIKEPKLQKTKEPKTKKPEVD